MKRASILLALLAPAAAWAVLAAGCGKDRNTLEAWSSSPAKVVEGIMHAYATRNDSLYADFLADDFLYTFEPQGGDSAAILSWGKDEEVLSASSLFHTKDVSAVTLELKAGAPRPATGPGREGWMAVPISGGTLTISVEKKEPTRVTLNRQEVVLRRETAGPKHWKVAEWHDYPVPGPAPATADTAHGGEVHAH